MLEKIRQLLQQTPFCPFKIFTSDGREYTIPSMDHAAVVTKGRVAIFEDNERITMISGLHITAVDFIETTV